MRKETLEKIQASLFSRTPVSPKCFPVLFMTIYNPDFCISQYICPLNMLSGNRQTKYL